jgi:putative flippase GtrA
VSSRECGSLSMRVVPVGRRWLKFNLVGALGIGVQLVALALLKSVLHVPYLIATCVAVELAVLHNFAWHERYTWRDHVFGGWRGRLRSLAAFHLTNGLVSVVGNVLLMRLFVGQLRISYFVANLLAIVTCGLGNFVLADRVAFPQNQKPFHQGGTETPRKQLISFSR